MKSLSAEKASDAQVDVQEARHSVQSSIETSTPPAPFPEGGSKAWATVLGAFLVQFCGFGYTTSFGVFQDYYVRQHITNESPSTISWIGGVNAFLIIVTGLVAGRIYDRGYFYGLLWGGSALSAFSLFMLSLTKEDQFYQVFLSQGVGHGLAAGLIYVPSLAVVSQYFQHRRNLVMAIVASGSSLGAIIHPIMLNNTLDRIGFAKATRANAGLISGLLFIACLLMRTRLPPPKAPPLRAALVKFSKDKAYLFAVFGILFFTMGLYFPIFYLQLDAIRHGLGQNFSFYALVILNGCSFIGRLSSGFLINKFGVNKLVIGSTACCSILIFGMIGINSVTSIVVIAVIYGYFAGVFIAMNAPFVANLADDISEIGLRLGIGLTLAGVGGLIGPPVDGALLTKNYHWWRACLFSGIVGTLGAVSYALSATLSTRKRRKMKKDLEEDKLTDSVRE
ncbi:hypothetical protein M422DRAFT_198467 [Sphaerobolus stellatus SS14]|nr:hypothetical protein M422DRAFT_198467 [Sphaerobolus stellatus SS14]